MGLGMGQGKASKAGQSPRKGHKAEARKKSKSLGAFGHTSHVPLGLACLLPRRSRAGPSLVGCSSTGASANVRLSAPQSSLGQLSLVRD